MGWDVCYCTHATIHVHSSIHDELYLPGELCDGMLVSIHWDVIDNNSTTDVALHGIQTLSNHAPILDFDVGSGDGKSLECEMYDVRCHVLLLLL